MVVVALFLLAVASGVLGRMGGAGVLGLNIWRRAGCSLIVVLAATLLLGWHPWLYAIMFGLHWYAFSTYWQEFFGGIDNLGFSGCVVGLASAPLLYISINLWWILLARTIILGVIWGCLNKYLPQGKVILWRRDVVEEFLRYFTSL